MCGRTQDVGGDTSFDKPASVHHLDGRAEFRDDPKVVCDQHDRCLALACDFSEYVEYLSLGGDVKSSGWLVSNDEIRPIREGNRDQNPLTHTARILVRVVVEAALRVRHFDITEQLDGQLARLALGDRLMSSDDVDHLRPNRLDRIECSHRVLEDERDLSSTNSLHLTIAKSEQIATV
jgi:hypothetical protein